MPLLTPARGQLRSTLLASALLLLLSSPAAAHESCCMKKARLAKLKLVPDPEAVGPDLDASGEPRLVVDATVAIPPGWDEEDDGPWEPPLVDNPRYVWKPPLIPNPDYDPPTFLAELKSEFSKAVPWVMLGTVVSAVLEAVQLPVNALGAVLNGYGPLGGALLGLATPLCSCGALPVAASFAASGVPLPTVVAFLTASQSAGLDSAAITWGLLGPQAALWRLGGAVFLALAAGLAAPRGRSGGGGGGSGCGSGCGAGGASSSPAAKAGVVGALLRLWPAAVSTAADVFPPVMVGLALSAAASRWMPPLPQEHDDISDGANDAAARLGLLAAALPLQLCEHTTVTAAAALQKAGGGPGLAFAFLLSAPATNVPSLLMLMRHGATSSARLAAVRVALAVTLAALVASYAVDAAGVDLLVVDEANAAASAFDIMPSWFVDVSPAIAAVLTAAVAVRRWWPVSNGGGGGGSGGGGGHDASPASDCCAAKKVD